MGFFIAIIIILLLPFIIRFVGRAIKSYAVGKMEDNMRRMMGMPSRAEERRKPARLLNDATDGMDPKVGNNPGRAPTVMASAVVDAIIMSATRLRI